MSAETPLFITNQVQHPNGMLSSSAEYHNIGTGVLRGSGTEVVTSVQKKYDLRFGMLPRAQRMGVIASAHTPNLMEQIAYKSQVYKLEPGQELYIATPSEVPEDALIAPYINVPEVSRQFPNHEIWGVHSAIVNGLKNKAYLHRLMDEQHVEGFEAPEHKILHVNEVASQGMSMLREYEDLYDRYGMGSTYKRVGLMLRAAESDGNYGAAMVYKENGKMYMVPNGDMTEKQEYNSEQEALDAAQNLLSEAINADVNAEIVASRLMDLEDSPGLTIVIKDGHVTSLGWNGQVQENGNAACTGTSTYRPKTEAATAMQMAFEDKSAEKMEEFVRKYAETLGIDFTDVTGFLNADLMLPGAQERELMRRMGKEPNFRVAEFNPRATNLSQALVEGTLVLGRPQTASELARIKHDGIFTLDRKPLYGADPKAVREALIEVHHALHEEDERDGVVVRMPTSPMGVIYYGNIEKVRNATRETIRRVREKAS